MVSDSCDSSSSEALLPFFSRILPPLHPVFVVIVLLETQPSHLFKPYFKFLSVSSASSAHFYSKASILQVPGYFCTVILASEDRVDVE